jgi:nucleoside-diphosphate-sugar epimerase
VKKALVTGGAGFIGSHLAEGLIASGWNVIVLDDLSSGLESNVPAGCQFVVGSADNNEILERILPKCHAIFHLAAVSSVQESLDKPLKVHDVNLTMTLGLLEAAVRHKVKRFIFSSSASVYGDTGGRPAREDMLPRPLSHYAVQKLACEYYCGVYRRLYGLETVCLRYFNIFGPRQRADSPYSGVIARFLDNAKQGKPLTIYGDGSQMRDFCPVANVVSANIAAARVSETSAGLGIFNIGTGRSISLTNLAATIISACPAPLEVVFGPARLGEIHTSIADIESARQGIGFQTIHSFEHAIQGLVKCHPVDGVRK